MKLHRVGAVAERVLRQLWHDRRVLAFMLLLPAVAMILFGYSFSGDIKGVRVGFIDEDKTDLTASILENLEKDDALVVRVVAPGQDPERFLLDDGYQAVVRIPAKFTSLYYAHFAMGVATSAQGRIDLALDESDPQIAAAVQKSLADALMDLGEGGPVDVQVQDLYGVEVRFIDSFAPAIMGMVVAMISTVLTLLSIVREKVDGTFARVWVSPVRRGEFILGYVLAFGLIALVQSLVVLTIGKSRLPHRDQRLDLLGVPVRDPVRGRQRWARDAPVGSGADGIAGDRLLPARDAAVGLLSGMMWPVQAIPALLRPLSYLVPLTYSNRVLRAVMVKGLAPWQEPLGFGGVLAFVVLTVVAASLVLRQQGRSANRLLRSEAEAPNDVLRRANRGIRRFARGICHGAPTGLLRSGLCRRLLRPRRDALRKGVGGLELGLQDGEFAERLGVGRKFAHRLERLLLAVRAHRAEEGDRLPFQVGGSQVAAHRGNEVPAPHRRADEDEVVVSRSLLRLASILLGRPLIPSRPANRKPRMPERLTPISMISSVSPPSALAISSATRRVLPDFE